MSMLLKMGLKEFFSSGGEQRSCFLLKRGRWVDTCVKELVNSASCSSSCNPPAVPYLGMYLTDLAFIEEGTPNFTEEGLVNFSKMRMVGSSFM